jgi:hypothetical protein
MRFTVPRHVTGLTSDDARSGRKALQIFLNSRYRGLGKPFREPRSAPAAVQVGS